MRCVLSIWYSKLSLISNDLVIILGKLLLSDEMKKQKQKRFNSDEWNTKNSIIKVNELGRNAVLYSQPFFHKKCECQKWRIKKTL